MCHSRSPSCTSGHASRSPWALAPLAGRTTCVVLHRVAMSFDGYGQGEGYSYMAGGGDNNYVAPRTGQSGEMGSFVTPADEASSKGWYSVHDSPDVRRAAKPHYVALYEDEDSSGEDSCVRSLPNFLGM